MPNTSATLGGCLGIGAHGQQTPKMRHHVDEVLKKQPAVVIGLAECQLESERVLEREPAEVAVAANSAAKRKFKFRKEYPYLTLRGK